MSEEDVNVMDVMTGERYTFPIRGLPFDGPYAVSIIVPGKKNPETILVKDSAELEKLARKMNGKKLLINIEY